MSYAIFTLMASVVVALTLAAIDRRRWRERIYVAARVFLCCVLTVWGGSWLMRLIHG